MKNAEPVLAHSEVVFMYGADADAYRAYGATFVGWGGAHTAEGVKMHHDLGIRCTGSMWCLTAGAKVLYEDPALLGAVSLDIEGKPVGVPWLFDHTHEGMRTYFGCTNHPTFQAHVREKVREAMAGGADGLHVDDHCGVATSAWDYGGGLCACCIDGFREYLKTHADPGLLRDAGVEDLATFDYRDLIRRYTETRETYLEVQRRIPLMDLFLTFHSESAAEHTRQLGELAAEAAGHPVLLSANACLPSKRHTYVLDHLTHVICEVIQDAPSGTRGMENAIAAYELAGAHDRPLAATASGHDWAFVMEQNCEELVRFWIALAYAHGQRFMAPHPTMQWCFSPELGTHWYPAPIEAFAPMYRFIRTCREWFDGFETGEREGITAPAHVHCTLRRNRDGRAVMHVLNTDYDSEGKAMRPVEGVRISLPKSQVPGSVETATLMAYDAGPQTVPVEDCGDRVEIELPRLRLWTVVCLT